MTTRNIISEELRDLDSTLENLSPQNLYAVPYGYFEGLPTQIINRIKALEARNAKEELEYLSPLLGNASKQTLYTVPANYFQDLTKSLLYAVNNKSDQASEEEIKSLSPLLSSLKNKNPYSVPAGYFATLKTKKKKQETKVISFSRRRWYRMAIAAAVIGIVTITGLMMINRKSSTISDSQAGIWIKNKVMNKVSPEKIDEFVTLIAPNNTQKNLEENKTEEAEIKELMKDVPQKEIDAFLNDAVALESNDDVDASMN